MALRVGVDIGGTFTDAIAISDNGEISTAKALTTSGRLADGVLSAIEALNIDVSGIDYFVHGTTAGLNAFLEKRGARVALITTRGFRDVYEIGRANRPDMYNLKYKSPRPLIERRDRFEVTERLASDGAVHTPVDMNEIKELVPHLKANYDAVAIVLLHSYKNPTHEQEIAKYLTSALPNLSIVTSSVVAPEWREYERTSTTAISAYIAPIINEYLHELGSRLKDVGLAPELKVMQSNGGVMSAITARSKPVQTLLSGPVGGTIAGVEIGKMLEHNKLICVDMGGTSFDVSLVVNKKADIEAQAEMEGHPLLSPSVSMHTIGAGGGSIAYVSAGALRVGPRSAGAFPGPACYDRGGTEPTVTDANLFLGRLPHESKLAGNMNLKLDLAKSALDSVGTKLNLSTEETAAGITAIINAAMANAIREITVSRGIDPREYSLVAYGGAGPLHAVAIAAELELGSVIVPANPGVLSAWGMLQADSRHDLVMNFYSQLKAIDKVKFEEGVKKLEADARQILIQEGITTEEMVIQPAADLRYVGQEYTVTVEWDPTLAIDGVLSSLTDLFESQHLVRYGHNNPGEDIELVNIRLSGIGLARKSKISDASSPISSVASGTQKTFFDGSWHEATIYWRDSLEIGSKTVGPATILENDCTTTIPPGWHAKMVSGRHLILERN
jgi:N-methylhydantoinase A